MGVDPVRPPCVAVRSQQFPSHPALHSSIEVCPHPPVLASYLWRGQMKGYGRVNWVLIQLYQKNAPQAMPFPDVAIGFMVRSTGGW
jgi:hypothetical protein